MPPRDETPPEAASPRGPTGTNAVAAIVLAGGRASRLGRDKATLMLGGLTLLERTRAAAREAGLSPVVVVGSQTGGGPVAAIAAGLQRLDAADGSGPDWVVVLPTDLARPGEALLHLSTWVDDLATQVDGFHINTPTDSAVPTDGAVLIDDDGREQWLTARYSVSALRRQLAELGDPADASVRALVRGLRLARIPAGSDAADIDTWEDYAHVRHLAP